MSNAFELMCFGATITLANRYRKNEGEILTFLPLSATIEYLKDLMGIKPGTSINLTTSYNGRKLFIASDLALQSYLMLVEFWDPVVA